MNNGAFLGKNMIVGNSNFFTFIHAYSFSAKMNMKYLYGGEKEHIDMDNNQNYQNNNNQNNNNQNKNSQNKNNQNSQNSQNKNNQNPQNNNNNQNKKY